MSRKVTKSSSNTVSPEKYYFHRIDRIRLELERLYTTAGIDLTLQVVKDFYLQVAKQHKVERPHLYKVKPSPLSEEEKEPLDEKD